MKPLHLFCIACLYLFSTSTYAAILLGSGQLLDNNTFLPAGSTSSTAHLLYSYSNSASDPRSARFDEVLTNSSAGTTFIYNSGTEFDKAAALLTNGLLDVVWGFPSTSGSGSGHFESTLFSDDLSLNGIDFEGYNISSIHWTIDSFLIESDKNYRTTISSSISIYGTAVVPIPPAFWLFGSGLLGLTGLARRKKAA